MSGKLIGRAMRDVRDVDYRTKFVLVALAEHCRGDSLEAWPSHATIAALTGIGERQVRDCLRLLIQRALIEPVGNKGGGRNCSTRYRLCVETWIRGDNENPVDVRRVSDAPNPADVRRVWTPEKAAIFATNPARVPPETRRTSADKPLKTRINSTGSTARRCATTIDNGPVSIQSVLDNFKRKPEKAERPHMTRAEQEAYVELHKESAKP